MNCGNDDNFVFEIIILCSISLVIAEWTLKLLPLLRACKNSKSLKQIKLCHQKVVTLGLQNDIYLCKNLISLYLSCHLYDHAKCVLDTMENPCEISLWNGLMAGYTKNYMYVEALELFEKLLCYPYLKPDSYTYPSVIKACGGLCRFVLEKMIHACLIRDGLTMDIVVGSSLVGMYAKCNAFEKAMWLFD